MDDVLDGCRKTRVGIAFCGGCNPGYDRVALAREIMEGLSKSGRFGYSRKGPFDAVVVVCGCDCACADTGRFGKTPIVMVTRQADVGEVLAALDGLAEKTGGWCVF